jgi:aminopeptidase
VIDPRIRNLAKILVHYSTGVKEGETCTIEGESAAEPLLLACYEEVLKAGGHPLPVMSLEGQQASYFKLASDAELDWVSPLARWRAEEADCSIRVMASTNVRELSGISPERQTRRQAAMRDLMATMMKRSADGSHRWALTLFPTNAYASEAEMSLADYEDFYY